MKPGESFIGQPIRDLQTMLRVIGKNEKRPELLIPDGIYGAKTMAQVSDFQRNAGLPVTGTADLVTWEAILEAYRSARINQIPAHPIHILLNADQILCKGDRCPHLYLVQAMLEVLAVQYRSVQHPSFSGRLDDATAGALRSFQKLSGLPQSGTLDKMTWKALVLQYPLAASLNPGEKDRQTARSD